MAVFIQLVTQDMPWGTIEVYMQAVVDLVPEGTSLRPRRDMLQRPPRPPSR